MGRQRGDAVVGVVLLTLASAYTLEALRLPVERELGAPIAFKIDMLRVVGGWLSAP